MEFDAILDQFSAAAARGDGARLAALFTPEGVYDDGFYGTFSGRDAIRAMIEERFHRDAEDFQWAFRDGVRGGDVGYARYLFSFTSRLPGAEGRRVLVEGVSCFHFAGAAIRRYDEVFDSGIAMAQLGFPPRRIAKSLARRAEVLRERPEAASHLTP